MDLISFSNHNTFKFKDFEVSLKIWKALVVLPSEMSKSEKVKCKKKTGYFISHWLN